MHQNWVGNTFASLASTLGFSGPFGASSQPFLASGPLLGLLWASGPLPSLFWPRGLFWAFCGLFPAFSGLGAFCGPFSGRLPSLFWPRGLFWAFCGLLPLFPTFSGLGAFSGPFVAFWAPSQPFLASGPFLGFLWASEPFSAFSGLASSAPFVRFWAIF